MDLLRKTLVGIVLCATAAASTAVERAPLIEAMADAVRDGYVDEVAIETAVGALQSTHWDADAGDDEIARLLTVALRDATGDNHFAVRHDPALFERAPDAIPSRLPDDPPGPTAAQLRAMAAENFHLRELAVMDGNVGYFRIDRMPDIGAAADTLAAAIRFLERVDALVLDLRYNPGGIGGFVPALASYLMPEPGAVLFRRVTRNDAREFRTDERAGGPLSTVPLFVLTGPVTGSAAENLAYTLQQHGRAVVVGSATGPGGAHSATVVRLTDGFVGVVPFARIEHPRTAGNWHRQGVLPDVDVPPSEVLSRAHRQALEALLADAGAASDDRGRWQAALRELDNPSTAARSDCNPQRRAQAAGRYGPRVVRSDGCRLTLQRDGSIPLELAPLQGQPGRFRLLLPEGARAAAPLPEISFERGDDGVAAIVFHHPDGRAERVARSAEPR